MVFRVGTDAGMCGTKELQRLAIGQPPANEAMATKVTAFTRLLSPHCRAVVGCVYETKRGTRARQSSIVHHHSREKTVAGAYQVTGSD